MKHQDQNLGSRTSSKTWVEESNDENLFNQSDMIFSYTRAQAITDGMLIDVSKFAGEVGFKVPVALTQAAWMDCVAWAEGTKPEAAQDEDGRLWDVLWMAAIACHKSEGDDQYRKFQLYRVAARGNSIKPKLTTLVVHIGPGDTAEPVITIMLPGED